jgi:hypothetical protein
LYIFNEPDAFVQGIKERKGFGIFFEDNARMGMKRDDNTQRTDFQSPSFECLKDRFMAEVDSIKGAGGDYGSR